MTRRFVSFGKEHTVPRSRNTPRKNPLPPRRFNPPPRKIAPPPVPREVRRKQVRRGY